MASFTDIVNDVYVITNRPDLVAETKREVRKATLKLHTKDFWDQDLKEAIITLPSQAVPRYSIDTTSVSFTRFRKAKQVNPCATSPQIINYPPLSIVEADNIFDGYQSEKINYVYQAGLNLQAVLFSNVYAQLRVLYYQLPDTSETTYTSWIANMYDQWISEEAARSIFKMIGKDEEFQKYEAICNENFASLRMIGITNESP